MRILITGANGFIGSALTPRLIAQGHQLFSVCRAGSVAVGEIISWDIGCDPEEAGFPATIDAVIHLAQSRAFRKFPENAPEMFDVNVRMTWALLQWAAKAQAKQFILASTGTVYQPFSGELHEEAALAPNEFLGASKLASEILARPYGDVLKLSVLRLFFPYGPGQQDRLIPDLIRRVRMGQTVQITKDGEGLQFSPIYVDDIGAIVIEFLNKAWSGTFNVAGTEVTSVYRIAGLIGKQLGISPKYERLDQGPLVIVPDIKRLAQHFDIHRLTRFEDGLQKTVACHL
jgi:nucleoside-diphosphate-sugar epimerase